MEAKELRIGNIVQELHGNTYRINNDVMVDIIDGHMKLDPIPLTEEWLIKFNWKYQDRDINTKKLERFYISPHFGDHNEYWFEFQLPQSSPFGHSFLWLNWDIGGGRKFVHMPKGHEIKYVHQFQNLYFALTGEELYLKET